MSKAWHVDQLTCVAQMRTAFASEQKCLCERLRKLFLCENWTFVPVLLWFVQCSEQNWCQCLNVCNSACWGTGFVHKPRSYALWHDQNAVHEHTNEGEGGTEKRKITAISLYGKATSLSLRAGSNISALMPLVHRARQSASLFISLSMNYGAFMVFRTPRKIAPKGRTDLSLLLFFFLKTFQHWNWGTRAQNSYQ